MSSTTETAVDPQVWEATYRQHAERLTRLATVLVGRDQAHDLVAETVLRCVRSATWATVDKPGAYLVTALVRGAHSAHRSDSARIRRETTASRLTFDRRTAHDEDRRPDLSAALDVLSPTQAAVVYLIYWEDLTIRDAATHLGVSEGSVRKQLDRAKRRLRKVIGDDADR